MTAAIVLSAGNRSSLVRNVMGMLVVLLVSPKNLAVGGSSGEATGTSVFTSPVRT